MYQYNNYIAQHVHMHHYYNYVTQHVHMYLYHNYATQNVHMYLYFNYFSHQQYPLFLLLSNLVRIGQVLYPPLMCIAKVSHGVVTNAIWQETGGYDGRGAYEFDGEDDKINVALDNSLNTQNLSISVWISDGVDVFVDVP